MTNIETLKRIYNELCALREQVKNIGTDEEWFNKALKKGLIPGDSFKVYKNLESYGPTVSIYIYRSESLLSGTIFNKLVGNAEYTAYNNKWVIQNFKN